MKPLQRVVFLCAFVGCLGGIPFALADENPQQADRSLKGDAVCTRCHDESEKWPILAMYKTRHGVKADTRTPGCQGCHGVSEAHVKNPGGSATSIRPTPDVTFGAKGGKYYAKSSPQVQSDMCVGCHQVGKRDHWAGSTHQTRDVACSSCHQIHTHGDKVLTKTTQPEVCYTCHKEQRAQMNRPSHHPIPEGKMACTDCHNPHGSVGPKLMKRDSVNDTCYTCHMEKRGPFVHTHEPVAEDCSNCHNPHGTTAESMLKMRPPFLCHTCHTPHGANVAQLAGQRQPSSLLSATTGGKSGINYTQGRGCLNCHTEVHGTNNPSTANPTPQFNFR
jgi:DmsE family decaheme c-type cytochrome